MDIFQNILMGFRVALSLQNLLFSFVGVTLGTLIGVLPGIGPVTGVAILIPITFGLNPTTAIITMAGVYYGAMYGGSTTSILINVPGESSSVMTTLDGYQMAKKGRAGPALGMAAFSSFIAGTFAVVLLTFIAPPLANVALSFGPPEYFALTFMGLTLVTSLSGESMLKGIMSGVFGLIVASVGVDAISGEERFTFGNIYLLDGMGFIGVAVGLFAVAEVLVNLEEPMKQVFVRTKLSVRTLFPNLQDWKDSLGPIGRSSLLGFFIGVLPGAGATIASFMSYAMEKKLSKHPEKFGTGIIEGVAAPEGANNAAAGGAMVPLLTLGIPGSGTTAVLLGALLIHGLRPGPLLFQNNPEFVWGVIASMYIGNVMLLVLNLPLVGIWASMLRVPYRILMPLIITISAVGVFATDNNVFDMWVMFAFGVIGYLMRKLDFPAAPAVLGLVLGPLVERSLRQSLTISHGDLSIFFTRPISAVLTICALLSLCAPVVRAVWQSRGKSPMEMKP
ncbi:MAG: transporter [candidate division NC10 bacterium RIFCSPLOWO2_12_FULL_66_18]|nr:MAG: transporter [candidate division NC10 bacterium RIFCSPLOWO2_02_FULL_66_22]OGB95939.1 MAG: transporter [candidate division NC10 bacterium RIFCSPLOWO2_12_FULL_66_18]